MSHVANLLKKLLLPVIVALSLTSCGADFQKPKATLESITLTPGALSMAVGDAETLKVTGFFSDGLSGNIEDLVTWESADTDIATVEKGVVTAMSVGSVRITASSNGIAAKLTVTVTRAALESIAVTPQNKSIAMGTVEQFTATGTFADGTTGNITSEVSWTSSNTGIATISNSAGTEGALSSLAVGSTTVTATLGSFSISTSLTVTDAELVSIQVTPATSSVASGTTQQFIATGTFSDATTQDITTEVVWESSDELIATITNAPGEEGIASALSAGTTTITASYNDTISGSTTLTVTTASLVSIAVTPANPSVAKGNTQQFIATGTYDDATTQVITSVVTWDSSDLGVATISNESDSIGLATGESEGTATITATLGLISGNTTLTVTPAELVSIIVTPNNPSIRNGTTQQFAATGVYTDTSTQDITTEVTWSSSSTGIATISNAGGSEGLASSVSAGTTTITATSGLISGNKTLTVLSVNLVSIDVTPLTPSIADGTSQSFTATGNFDDASTQDLTGQVLWDSSDLGVATISNTAGQEGYALGIDPGTATITATLGLISGNTTLTVTSAVVVSVVVTPATPSVAKGNTQQFIATGTFSDASMQDITEDAVWDSSDLGVATISNDIGSQGLAATLSEGTATMTATFDGVPGNTVLTVTAAELVTIDVEPANQSIDLGETLPFTATGTYTDETTLDITSSVTWDSSDTDVATISNSLGSEGLATGVDNGTTTITATQGMVSDSTTLTVETLLDHVVITPTTPTTLRKGLTRQLTATAYYTNGSTADVTDVKTRWSTSNANSIKMNVNNTAGKIKAVKRNGSSIITFTYTENGITKSDTLTITAIP